MSEIESKVKAIIVDKLGVDEAEVKPEASFTNDLGADSLDTVELIMEFEKEFVCEACLWFYLSLVNTKFLYDNSLYF